MTSKRRAVNELTDRNWDEEDEKEEPGTFARANSSVMQSRVIKRAKHRIVKDTTQVRQENESKSAFSGFAGFGKMPLGASLTEQEVILPKAAENNQASPDKKDSETESKPVSKSKVPEFTFKNIPSNPALKSNLKSNSPLRTISENSGGDEENVNASARSKDGRNVKTSDGTSSDYFEHIECLNTCFVEWITKHVNRDAHCLLTPTFADYEKHVQTITENYPLPLDPVSVPDLSEEKDNHPPSPKLTITPAPFSFKQFAQPDLTSASSAVPITTAPAPFSGFNFASTTAGFSFATSAVSAPTSSSQDDEEYEPPKVEVTTHVEEDALYTIRCKLFYQKDGKWIDKGVGFVHLKKADDKCQLLIRADNNLGTILLNISVPTSLPVKRQGKNNVSLLCVPNPPMDPKMDDSAPVALLIRVKTESDADTFLEKITQIREST